MTKTKINIIVYIMMILGVELEQENDKSRSVVL